MFLLPLSEGVGLPLSLIVHVIMPGVLWSGAVAVAARSFERLPEGKDPSVRAAGSEIRPIGREILAAGLMSGMIILFVFVFLRGFGLLLTPLFYGPPILIQVIALEATPLQRAWPRMRELMRGSWGRIIMALLGTVLAIAMLSIALLSAIFPLVGDAPQAIRVVVLTALQALVIGATMPYLAALQVAAYKDLIARHEAA